MNTKIHSTSTQIITSWANISNYKLQTVTLSNHET